MGIPGVFLPAKSTLICEIQGKERPVTERGLDAISEDGTLGGTICLHTYTYATSPCVCTCRYGRYGLMA